MIAKYNVNLVSFSMYILVFICILYFIHSWLYLVSISMYILDL